MSENIVFITSQFSIVVKSIEKGLTEQGYAVTLLDADIEKIGETLFSTDVYILYLHDAMLDDKEQIEKTVEICDMLREKKEGVVLIGSEPYREAFLKLIPYFEEYSWIKRPVDVASLMREIDKEAERVHAGREKKKILIIDDDHLYSGMIAEWLKGRFQVERADSGMQGLSWLAKNPVDMILLDYDMPVADGATIFEMLRKDPGTAFIPVIFLTGISSRESITRVMAYKPQGYVLKSAGRDELFKVLNRYFDRHSMALKGKH